VPFLKIEVHNIFVTGKKLKIIYLSVHVLMFRNLGEFYSHQRRLSFLPFKKVTVPPVTGNNSYA
jgi:hypothetical protein